MNKKVDVIDISKVEGVIDIEISTQSDFPFGRVCTPKTELGRHVLEEFYPKIDGVFCYHPELEETHENWDVDFEEV